MLLFDSYFDISRWSPEFLHLKQLCLTFLSYVFDNEKVICSTLSISCCTKAVSLENETLPRKSSDKYLPVLLVTGLKGANVLVMSFSTAKKREGRQINRR